MKKLLTLILAGTLFNTASALTMDECRAISSNYYANGGGQLMYNPINNSYYFLGQYILIGGRFGEILASSLKNDEAKAVMNDGIGKFLVFEACGSADQNGTINIRNVPGVFILDGTVVTP